MGRDRNKRRRLGEKERGIVFVVDGELLYTFDRRCRADDIRMTGRFIL